MLKDWINKLSEDFLQYDCVYSVYENAEDNTVQSWSRQDKLITSCYIDGGHSECTFSSNRPEPLCNNSSAKSSEAEKTKNKPTKKKTKQKKV